MLADAVTTDVTQHEKPRYLFRECLLFHRLRKLTRFYEQMREICLRLLHLPPGLHPFILGDVPCEHLPPPLLQHVGERQSGHNGERLFKQEVDLNVCEAKNTKYFMINEVNRSESFLLLV